MRLKIVQAGEPVLRQRARALTKDEIMLPAIQQLIEHMRETMHDAPGVGLAAPQIGLPIQMAVIVFFFQWEYGYFWTGRGVEFALLWCLLCIAIFFRGGGKYSLDRLIGREF